PVLDRRDGAAEAEQPHGHAGADGGGRRRRRGDRDPGRGPHHELTGHPCRQRRTISSTTTKLRRAGMYSIVIASSGPRLRITRQPLARARASAAAASRPTYSSGFMSLLRYSVRLG